MLIPEEVRQIHAERVKEWLEGGKSADEEAFKIREMRMLLKDGKQVEIIKYFKI